MRNSRRFIHVEILATAVVTALLFSSLTLWLVASPIKYLLFAFETCAVVVSFLVASDYTFWPGYRAIRLGRDRFGLALRLCAFIVPLTLLMMRLSAVQAPLLQVFLSLLSTSFLPGYCLMKILGVMGNFSRLESFVFSFILSYAFIATLTFVTLVTVEGQPLIVLSVLTLLGLLSVSKREKGSIVPSPSSFSRRIDVLAILLVSAFYAIAFYLMYPGFAVLPDSDVSRHYASSIVLGRTPDLYTGTSYVFFHLFESTFLKLSTASFINAQDTLVLLDLLLPLAFYVMARRYLESIDGRLSALSTIFWTIFTNSLGGFAWLDFLASKLTEVDQTQIQLLGATAVNTYNGTIYGIVGLWFVPAVVSLIGFMVLMWLIRIDGLPKWQFFTLFSVTLATLYLTHVAEAVIFALFLSAYGVLADRQNSRIDDSLRSSVFGFVLVAFFLLFLSIISVRFTFNASQMAAFIVPSLAMVFSLGLRKVGRPRLLGVTVWLRSNAKPLLRGSILLAGFFYVIAFLSWWSLRDSFQVSQVSEIGLVPWVMFPLILGINGLLAILSLYSVARGGSRYRLPLFFLALLIFTFLGGRILSALNLYVADTGYPELRLVWLTKLPLACLAPLPLVIAINKLREKRLHASAAALAATGLIGLLVLGGASTTLLNLEYWSAASNNVANQLSAPEIEGITFLKNLLDTDSKAWIVAITGASEARVTFAAPADMLGVSQLLYTASTPEMAFNLLYRHPAYSHPFVYVENRDLPLLNSQGGAFLAQYLRVLPVIFNNAVVQIYNATKPSFLQSKSDAALVIPFDKAINRQGINLAYELLSQGFYNYSSFFDLDNGALSAKTIILPIDPPKGNVLSSTFYGDFTRGLSAWNTVNGVWTTQGESLIGGEAGRYTQGSVLSPVSSHNFTASFGVTPTSGNLSVANYVRLIFSWIDSVDYSIADVLFNTDGYIYALFRVYTGGIERDLPSWPGVRSNFRWTFGSKYNVTVGVTGNLDKLMLNGVQLLSVISTQTTGKIGLGYLRFFDVSFNNFTIVTSTIADLRPINDYLSYLRSGGKIIILNTNGYGYFAEGLFHLSNLSLIVNAIDGPSFRADLPIPVRVPKVSITNQNTTTVSLYVSPNDSSPYISKTTYGRGELTYVDLAPISNSIIENASGPAFYWMMGRLLDDLKLDRLDTNALPNVDGYVRQLYLSNTVTATTQSLLFPLGFAPPQLEVRSQGGSFTFIDAANLSITSGSSIVIQTGVMVSQPGEGLYAVLQVNSKFSINSTDGVLGLSLTAGGKRYNISKVLQIQVTPRNQTNLLLRTPTLSAQHVAFYEFYPFGSLQSSTRTYGENLIVGESATTFSIAVSDNYSSLVNVSLGRSLQRDPPLTSYDDRVVLPTAIFWILSSLPLLVAALAISVSRSREEKLSNHEK